LREKATEIRFEGTDYLIVPHAAILALVRDTPEEGRSETTVDELLDDE
jgi:hypothetical protein